MIEEDYSPGYTVFQGIEVDPDIDKSGLKEFIEALMKQGVQAAEEGSKKKKKDAKVAADGVEEQLFDIMSTLKGFESEIKHLSANAWDYLCTCKVVITRVPSMSTMVEQSMANFTA